MKKYHFFVAPLTSGFPNVETMGLDADDQPCVDSTTYTLTPKDELITNAPVLVGFRSLNDEPPYGEISSMRLCQIDSSFKVWDCDLEACFFYKLLRVVIYDMDLVTGKVSKVTFVREEDLSFQPHNYAIYAKLFSEHYNAWQDSYVDGVYEYGVAASAEEWTHGRHAHGLGLAGRQKWTMIEPRSFVHTRDAIMPDTPVKYKRVRGVDHFEAILDHRGNDDHSDLDSDDDEKVSTLVGKMSGKIELL